MNEYFGSNLKFRNFLVSLDIFNNISYYYFNDIYFQWYFHEAKENK